MTSKNAERLNDLGFRPDDVRYRAHIRPIGKCLLDLQPPQYLLRVFGFDLYAMSPLQLSEIASSVRYTGDISSGGRNCPVVELIPPASIPPSTCSKLTLVLDPAYGYLPRHSIKESVTHDGTTVYAEKEALQFEEVGEGAFLATDVSTRDRTAGNIRQLSRFRVTRITHAVAEPRGLSQVFFPNQLVQIVEQPFDPENPSVADGATAAVQLVDESGKLGKVFEDQTELQAFMLEKTPVRNAGHRVKVLATALTLLLISAFVAWRLLRRRRIAAA
ncbi:hypothetical protein [Roseimaritima sediminicola]|uniref:hypothetical protein n=1 Tax=Roseimaritima sediminicola TaxID=2662066 RepID=UPI0012982FDE|nr:hypothetical protein [Roseimaritima sediminicola]